MNYLCHLYLSDPAPESLVGSLLGDFVKGRLDATYSPAMTRAIALHRRVDSFAHTHPAVRRSKARLDPSFRHYKPILVDIFYDHFLAGNWSRYSPLPLSDFARQVYRALRACHDILPERMQQVAERMIAHDWLTSYREVATIGTVLERMSLRLSRPNPVGSGVGELIGNYAALEADFEEFLPQAVAYVHGLRGI